MKKYVKKYGCVPCVLMVAALVVVCGLLACFGLDLDFAATLAMAAPAIVEGGVDTTKAKAASPDLIMAEVEKKVTDTFPDQYLLTTIVNNLGRRVITHGLTHEWYISYYLKKLDTTTAATVQTTGAVEIPVANRSLFAEHQTVMVNDPTILGTDGNFLMLFVQSIAANKITCIALNGTASGNQTIVPALPNGTKLVICGRAKAEKDWNTDSKEGLPVKENNLIQTFMSKVEQSEYQKLVKKEVEWGFSDYTRQNIRNMRWEQENSYLFGFKKTFFDDVANNEKQTCNGILRYGIKQLAAPAVWTNDVFVDFAKSVFTGNNGSDRRFFLCGSEMMAKIQKTPMVQRQQDAGASNKEINIDWTRIKVNSRSLDIKEYPILDESGFPDAGLIIDPANIGKAIFRPFEAIKISLDDNRITGQNVESMMIREASCPTVYNAETHAAIGFV